MSDDLLGGSGSVIGFPDNEELDIYDPEGLLLVIVDTLSVFTYTQDDSIKVGNDVLTHESKPDVYLQVLMTWNGRVLTMV